MNAAKAAQPFARGTVLAMLVVGAALFIALLWFLGHSTPPTNNGGGHAGGRGLNGYAGLAALAQADGFAVARTRSQSGLDKPGVLILTPLPETDGKTIDRIVAHRRRTGPTIVVAPKWLARPLERKLNKPRGWTRLVGATLPQWSGFADDVTVTLDQPKDYQGRGWRTADGRRGPLPDDQHVESGTGQALVPLVTTPDGRILAVYRDDNGHYPALDALANVQEHPLPPDDADEDSDSAASDKPDSGLYPVILVFEPDLLDNAGLADRRTARLALDLLHAAAANDGDRQIVFDLSLAGLGGRPNLLTLAFEPPFLAATIGLLLALLAVGWRAFCRFGPARTALPAIPPGKATLVSNSADLIRRAGRIHLLTGPFADGLRERLVHRLGLRRGMPAGETDALVDAHLARLRPQAQAQAQPQAQPQPQPQAMPFSLAVAQLSAARNAPDAVRAAQALHAIEKDLA